MLQAKGNDELVWLAPEQVQQQYGPQPIPRSIWPVVGLLLAIAVLLAVMGGCWWDKLVAAALARPDGSIVDPIAAEPPQGRPTTPDGWFWIRTARAEAGPEGKAKQ